MTKKGSQKLQGLNAPVEVLYDQYGIPHIEAQNDKDMMYALGYITASERLFQMDLLRRIGSGRLSEILGKDLLKSDILLRKAGLKRHANFLWKKYKQTAPPHMLMQIEAYFKGVNHYIKTQPLPLEMKLLRYKPDPFAVEDSIAAGGYMALNFAEGFIVDILYTDLLDEFSLDTVDSLFKRGAYDSKALSKPKSFTSYTPSKNYYKTTALVINRFKQDMSLFHGSNAWLLSGFRTKSGKPILANDPHIAFAQPGTWFEAHIKSPTYENYGHYLPLLPFPGLAHNKDRAWGITMSNSDDLDFYKEKLHPTNTSLVMYKGKYVKLKKITETIKIKGEDDHIEEVLITPHGPILDNTKFVKKDSPLSLKWGYLDPENNSIYTFYLLSQSKTLDELAPALSHATAPGFNIMFADSKGSIGWHVMGKIPIKARPENGNTVLEGSSGIDEYKGHLSIIENPHSYNPENGAIVSANYKHQYNGKISWVGLWQPKNRYMRISHLLNKNPDKKWDINELKKMQTEEYVNFHKDLISYMFKHIKLETPLQKEASKILKKWDGKASTENVEPSIFYSMFQLITKYAIFDELGKERFESYLEGADAAHFFLNIEKTSASKIWDDVSTQKIESQGDIFQKAFDESIKTLSKRFNSNDPKTWKWGEIHTITYNHPMGKFFPLDKIFNVGPFSVGGGMTQINNMGHIKKDMSFDVFYGPSTRRLIDLAHPKLSLGGLPSGNSGHPTSKHYDDQAKMFLSNTYRDQIMDTAELKKREHITLTLTP